MRVVPAAVGFMLVACGGHKVGPECMQLCTSPSWSTLDLVAGRPGGPGWVDGPPAAAHFADPWTFASDGAGHLFLADGQTLRQVDLTTGNVTTLAGAYGVTGTDDGVGAAARFFSPSGLAASSTALYVADTENHTLRKVDLATGTVTTLSGAPGVGGTLDATGTDARFREPEGLWLEGQDLYVADTDNDTIRKLALATGAVTTVAGVAGMRGTTDGTADIARFNQPKAMAGDHAGHVFILDNGNQSLRQLTLADFSVTTIATLTVLPIGLAVDGASLVVSLEDSSIVHVALAGGAVTPFAGAASQPGFIDGDATTARFSRPAGLFNDGAGHLIVADGGNQALRRIALASAAVTTLAGSNPIGTADGADARFFAPQGLAADANGRIYVADTNNHTVRMIENGQVTTLAGKAGELGAADGTKGAARFNQPVGLALDDGTLWVADSGNRALRRVDLASGAVTTVALDHHFKNPHGLALAAGVLYVSDYEDHTVLSLTGTTVTLVAGSAGVPGSRDGAKDAARFDAPAGLAADGQGALYVADVLNNAVRKIELATGQVTTVSTTNLSYPTQVAVDGVGDLFVADSTHPSVTRLTNGQQSIVIGDPLAAGVAPGPLPARLALTTALALTPEVKLVLASESSILLAH